MTLPIAPSQTLYFRNLDDRVSAPELKRQLYCLISSVAPVVEIEAKRSPRTRGQAWVSFSSIEVASVVMQRLQGFNLLGKEMKIEYAKKNSKCIAEFYESAKAYEDKANDSDGADEEGAEDANTESNVLRVQGFPPKANAIILSVLFRQIEGYQKVDVKDGYALVYYESSEHAKDATTKFQDFRVSGDYHLKITYETAEAC